ncbi:MAG: hypothetical protein EBY09_18865 [Verrucomicrobia bacterium]|nr:hypothetical protein [Verrucomicrobiota bacterium]
MSATVTIEDIGFRDKLNQLAARGLDAGRVLKVEARRLLAEVVRQTPPASQGQGRAAVNRDLAKVFAPVGPAEITLAKRTQRKSAADYLPLWTSRGGKLYAVTHENFQPNLSADAMAKTLDHKRDSRGQVRTFSPRLVAQTRKRTMVNRIVVKRTEFNRFKRLKLSHVGKLRSGWGHALQSLGASLPDWVTRNLKPETGFVVNNLGQGQSPSLTAGNTSAGARTNCLGILKRAINARRMAIGENLKRMLKHGPGASGDYGYAKE